MMSRCKHFLNSQLPGNIRNDINDSYALIKYVAIEKSIGFLNLKCLQKGSYHNTKGLRKKKVCPWLNISIGEK